MEAVVNLINHPENKIYFWYRKGKGVNRQYLWLKENLQEKLCILGTNHITLYIWLGTCDLTVKSDQFIKICSEDFSAVRSLCKGLKDIFDYIRVSYNYACISWNPILFYIFVELDHENFRKQDTALEIQVTEVNKYIEQLNSHSQKFSMFLFRSEKNPENIKTIHLPNTYYITAFSWWFTPTPGFGKVVVNSYFTNIREWPHLNYLPKNCKWELSHYTGFKL